jgi:Thioesterase-like superfamily
MAVPESLFVREAEAIRATELARGPWDPNALHGGPVAALCAWVAERHDPGPASFVARLTLELMRPVPLGRLHVQASTVRPGARVQWIDVAVHDDDGRLVAAAHALRLRRAADAVFAVGDVAQSGLPARMPRPPEESGGPPIGLVGALGFWSANDFRMAGGDWQLPGPGAAWLRLRVPVIDDEPVSPLQRAVAAADFGSGVGNPVRLAGTGTINAELTVHLHRPAVGEWIGLDARAVAYAEGVGLADTVLHDVDGPIGRAAQSLVVVDNVPFTRDRVPD